MELPVQHEKFYYTPDGAGGWREVRTGSPAKMLSPESARYTPHIPHGFDTYSPRLTETAYVPRLAWGEMEGRGQRGGGGGGGGGGHGQQFHQPGLAHSPQQAYPAAGYGKHDPVPVPVMHVHSQGQGAAYSPSQGSPHSPGGPLSPTPSSAPSALVTVSRMKPGMEVSKPYETSDFYKYSERLRKQRIIDNYQRQLMGGNVTPSRASTPSSDTSDSHSLHSSHSGSSMSHSMRLAAASAAYYAAAGGSGGGGGKSGGDLTARGPPSYTSTHTQYLKPDSDQQRTYSARSDPSDHSSYREQTPYSNREQGLSSSSLGGGSGGGGGGSGHGLVQSSSASDFQTAHSTSSSQPHVRYASSQSQSYRAQYMQAVATSSATHARYQPPSAMSCQPVTSQAYKDTGKGRGQ
jgi:hypothetical protein